jgi:hypothetical protein
VVAHIAYSVHLTIYNSQIEALRSPQRLDSISNQQRGRSANFNEIPPKRAIIPISKLITVYFTKMFHVKHFAFLNEKAKNRFLKMQNSPKKNRKEK